MLRIHTVLCPIDFSDANIRELEMAVDVCRSFGARLILHHNVHASPLGASTAWMWQQEHHDQAQAIDDDGAADLLRDILAELPLDIDAEARLSNGLAAPSILSVEDQTGADLVIMATQGPTTKDHASVTEKVVERSRCPVLVWHGDADAPALRFEPISPAEPLHVLVPTDLTAASEQAVAYACELARLLPLRLHLLHVLAPARSLWVLSGVSPSMPAPAEADLKETAYRKLELLVPKDLRERMTLHVEAGEPADKISEVAHNLGISCIVMGAHARSLLRRLFTRDTSRELIHKTSCPVWFVPESQAA
jgi:universal stress protein A